MSAISHKVSGLVVGGLALSAYAEQAFKLDSRKDILDSSSTLASDLMEYYKGDEAGEIPGLLSKDSPSDDDQEGYWWYHSGQLMNVLIDYWHWTGDSEYNKIVMEGLQFQQGPESDFRPTNQTASLGLDDQCFWGLAAMSAAEWGLADPSPENATSWLDLATNVFHTQTATLQTVDNDNGTCDGGLRWQYFPTNAGFEHMNTLTNGCYFDLAARLARYTNNETYAEAAEKTWDWMKGVGLLDSETGGVYDGVHTTDNCSQINRVQFSTAATFLAHGAAFLYNTTDGSDTWKDRLELVTESIVDLFFPNGTAYETACERRSVCTSDMIAMKGVNHRLLSVVPQLAPFLNETLSPTLRTSAEAAVKQCTGGDSGRQCGFYWASGKFELPEESGSHGALEEMNVLSAVSGLLAQNAEAPGTQSSPLDKEDSSDDDDADNEQNGGENGDGESDDNDDDADEDSEEDSAESSALKLSQGDWGLFVVIAGVTFALSL